MTSFVKKIVVGIWIPIFLFYTPASASQPNFTYAIGFFEGIYNVFVDLLPILVALAFFVFVWGLVVFISQSGDDKAREEGKKKIVWGVVALFVITAIWGILALLQTMAGVNTTNNVPIDPPGVPKVAPGE